MDKLPKDVVELITNKLTPREFFNYSKSETGQEFCSRKDIWLRRIQKDFGFLLEGRNKDLLLPDYRVDPKRSYLELFLHTSRAAEEITSNIIQTLGNAFRKFIVKDYDENLYNFFFKYLLKMINVMVLPQEEGDEEFEIRTSAKEYFWEHSSWDKYLPILYHTELADMFNEEIGDVLSTYAVAIFLPQISKN